jgi:hypothetical protein
LGSFKGIRSDALRAFLFYSNPSLMLAWLGKTKKPWIASGDPSRGEASKPEKNTPEAGFIFCFTEPPFESELSLASQ